MLEAVEIVRPSEIVPSSLFVQITVKMERGNVRPSALVTSFEERPETLYRVRMHFTTHILFRVIDERVTESILPQSRIAF